MRGSRIFCPVGGGGVLKTYFSHQREPEGSNCFSSGVRTSISKEATCDFPGEGGLDALPPPSGPAYMVFFIFQ